MASRRVSPVDGHLADCIAAAALCSVEMYWPWIKIYETKLTGCGMVVTDSVSYCCLL